MTTNPRALHIVLNGVTEDSRVLKSAWSLGNAGWDVLVVGATPHTYSDQIRIGYSTIKRLPLKPVITQDLLAKILRRLRYYWRRLQIRLGRTVKVGIPNYKRALSAIEPVAMEFKPQIIHAHDYTALPIAGALVEQLQKSGYACHLIYDAHEYVPGVAHLTAPLKKIYTEKEVEYSATAAAILSVSEGMNELLMPHLRTKNDPEIVANDPLVEGQLPSMRNLRDDCGIDQSIPLLVYSGAVAPQRGVGDVLLALREMPDVHLALIANPTNATVQKYVADFADIRDRFHVLPYVPNAQLVSYLSGADIGLIPIHHKQNHEISLITKFGEYMQARLPILVSDVKTMSEEVRRLGNGEVFKAGSVEELVAGIRKIISDPNKYSSVYTPEVLAERSWERQVENLVGIYNRVAGLSPQSRPHLSFTLTEPERM